MENRGKNYTWYAVQVPPEQQKSDFDDLEKEGLIFAGNKYFLATGEELLQPWKDHQAEIEENFEVHKDNALWRDGMVKRLFPKASYEILDHLADLYYKGKDKTQEYTCLILQAITGKVYDYTCINGVCQGDWQYVLYPTEDWSIDQIRDFGARYFNTGTEWFCVEATNVDSDDPKDIFASDDGFYHYSTEWDSDKIRKELANNVGCRPDELKMFPFKTYIQVPSWEIDTKEVDAE